jgi:hypothetical protein
MVPDPKRKDKKADATKNTKKKPKADKPKGPPRTKRRSQG